MIRGESYRYNGLYAVLNSRQTSCWRSCSFSISAYQLSYFSLRADPGTAMRFTYVFCESVIPVSQRVYWSTS